LGRRKIRKNRPRGPKWKDRKKKKVKGSPLRDNSGPIKGLGKCKQDVKKRKTLKIGVTMGGGENTKDTIGGQWEGCQKTKIGGEWQKGGAGKEAPGGQKTPCCKVKKKIGGKKKKPEHPLRD